MARMTGSDCAVIPLDTVCIAHVHYIPIVGCGKRDAHKIWSSPWWNLISWYPLLELTTLIP